MSSQKEQVPPALDMYEISHAFAFIQEHKAGCTHEQSERSLIKSEWKEHLYDGVNQQVTSPTGSIATWNAIVSHLDHLITEPNHDLSAFNHDNSGTPLQSQCYGAVGYQSGGGQHLNRDTQQVHSW